MAHANIRYVLQVKHGPGLGWDHQVLDLFNILKIPPDGNRPGHTADVHIPGRDCHILIGQRIFNILECEGCGRKLIFIYINLHFLIECSNHIHPCDLTQFLHFILNLIRIIL